MKYLLKQCKLKTLNISAATTWWAKRELMGTHDLKEAVAIRTIRKSFYKALRNSKLVT